MVRTVLVKAAKGIIDTTPLWDEDGRVYLAHAYAGSRAGLKSVIAVCELSADATRTISPSRIVFDGHEAHETCEGPKFYKRNGYYYIFIRLVVFLQAGRSYCVRKTYTDRMNGKPCWHKATALSTDLIREAG